MGTMPTFVDPCPTAVDPPLSMGDNGSCQIGISPSEAEKAVAIGRHECCPQSVGQSGEVIEGGLRSLCMGQIGEENSKFPREDENAFGMGLNGEGA